jgi:hypothetical protein
VNVLETNRQIAVQFLAHAFANRFQSALALLCDDATW